MCHHLRVVHPPYHEACPYVAWHGVGVGVGVPVDLSWTGQRAVTAQGTPAVCRARDSPRMPSASSWIKPTCGIDMCVDTCMDMHIPDHAQWSSLRAQRGAHRCSFCYNHRNVIITDILQSQICYNPRNCHDH